MPIAGIRPLTHWLLKGFKTGSSQLQAIVLPGWQTARPPGLPTPANLAGPLPHLGRKAKGERRPTPGCSYGRFRGQSVKIDALAAYSISIMAADFLWN